MLVFLFCVCMTTLSYAQHVVSGVVKDVTGEPVIGANVVEKGLRMVPLPISTVNSLFPSPDRRLRCLFPTSVISRKIMLTRGRKM